MGYRFLPVILVFFILSMFQAGCTVKKMAKQAAQFESVGMFKEAADLYYQASIKKPQAVEYKTGLKRSGQMYLEDMASGINHAFNRGDYKKVVYDYLSMQDFTAKVKRTGMDLNIDYSTQRLYENASELYLTERYEQGQKLITDQSYEEAKKVFSEIHQIKPDFRDTKNYLNTATLEPMYQNGSNLFSQRKYMDAYREWEKVSNRDPGYKDVKNLMQQALSERYKEGTLLLIDENFDAAAIALGDVYRINSGYLDVRSQYFEACNEPIYRRSNQQLTAGKCRTAYFGYDNIIKDAGDYKDSRTLKEQALACAQYPVAVHSGSMPQYSSDGKEFENVMLDHLLKLNDPFLKIHKLSVINSKIDNSFRGNPGSFDRSQLKELHDRNGIKAVLILSFSEYTKVEGKLEKFTKTGFERQVMKSTTGETTFYDKKVTYIEYMKNNGTSLTMSYQLISTLTGEILLSQRLEGNETDKMHYATYEGEQKNLYPAALRNNTYSLDDRNYSSLQSLLKSDARITSADKLRDKVFVDLSEKIANAVKNFNPEK
ncbi:MAG: hypothetical protein IH598_08010 [Bacteroidales bacterium]|nr:hypothetical protein [Bacteroidales bacterium]